MFELALELSKRLPLKGDANGSSIFAYFLLGPILLIGTLALFILKLYLSSELNSAWLVGCILSLMCNFLITVLSFREGSSLFSEKIDQLIAENAQLTHRMSALQEEPRLSQEVPPSPHPYDELRKQFDEKSAVLNETRKELFDLEGKYLTLQKEMENHLLEPSREIQELLKHCSEIEIYCNRLEEDLKNHQELLTEISFKKPVRKVRKTPSRRVKVDETIVADLFTEPSKKAKVSAE